LKVEVTGCDTVVDECDNDTEAPTLACPMGVQSFTLDVCGQTTLTLEDFGITAADNCSENVTISLSQTEFVGAGDTQVMVTAIDEAGNAAICSISVTLENNPDAISVTAGDDNFTTPQGESITFSIDDLLVNDDASDGSPLEIQDLTLANPDDGTFEDNGDSTYTFTPADGFFGAVILTYVAKSEDASLFFEGTGNFYEFIAVENITWQEAKAAAEARSLNGINGYLATVTSQAENDFIASKLEGFGWMGASDEEEEGTWKWVTGPEAGMEFWRGNGSGMATNGMYFNWSIGEPNDFISSGSPEGEDYGHFSNSGQWNDYPASGLGFIEGYVVEYGGVGGCVPDFADDATIVITVTESVDECDDDTEAPQIFAVFEDGSQILASELNSILEGVLFECDERPSFELIVSDNCDPDAAFVSGGNSITVNDDGTSTFVASSTARDASGNETVVEYSYTFADTKAPMLDCSGDAQSFTLDVCGLITLTPEDLGITATDNCSENVTISLNQSAFEGAGNTEIVVTAVDENGNEETCTIALTLENNPDAITVTVNDDNFMVSEGETITFNVLANDMASDGSALEVQDLVLANPDDGTLVNNGDGTYDFTPADGFVGEVILTYVAKSEDASLFFEGTGNFYEFIAANGITWQEAKLAAEAQTLNGVSGYLVTVTSQEENDFILSKLEGQGWMGGSDVAVDDEWRWVTGPEGEEENGAGRLFWVGKADGMAPDGIYANWEVNEPNDFRDTDENYAHFRLT